MITRRDLGLMVLMASLWAFHFVVIKLTVSEAPPLFYAALRMTIVAIVLAPFLRIFPGQMGRVALVGVCLGGLNFAFLFVGLKYASASVAAIVIEIGIPIVTIMSVIFLKEKIGWRRGVSIAAAFFGACLVGWRPNDAALTLGAGLLVGVALAESTGAILVKTLKEIKPIQLQAWVGVVGAIFLWGLTLALEDGQVAAMRDIGLPFVGAVLYSSILSSVVSHTIYYYLLQKYAISQIAPTLLMVPILTVTLGVTILGDQLTPLMIIGGGITIAAVGVILFRSDKKGPATTAAIEGV